MARSKPKFPLDHDPAALTWARERAGLSKKTFSEKAGVSLSLLCEMEAGTRNAGVEWLHKFARVLNCPVVFLERKRTDAELGIPATEDVQELAVPRKVA